MTTNKLNEYDIAIERIRTDRVMFAMASDNSIRITADAVAWLEKNYPELCTVTDADVRNTIRQIKSEAEELTESTKSTEQVINEVNKSITKQIASRRGKHH